MSLHQALGPLMWARVTAAAGWAWPPPREPCRPPGARVGGVVLQPHHAYQGHLHPGRGLAGSPCPAVPES